MTKSLHDFEMKSIDGKSTSLKNYEGKVVLIVNVASKCGLTPQYEGLEKLYETYKSRGFEVLGFPANEFGAQEPGSNNDIQQFCTMNYGVKFPMFEKIVVKGSSTHPLYKFLTQARPVAKNNPGSSFEKKLRDFGVPEGEKGEILWNFEKFLVGKNGQVVERFAPDLAPQDALITNEVEKALK